MKSTIRLLSDQTIGQIAAGEVIERPASVIKELLENALDAGATSIHIEIAGGGRKLMRVTDNGSGIVSDQVPMAFMRHATSKLSSVDELSSISTLGFRGEALASIGAVSQVTLVTRHQSDVGGSQLKVEGGGLSAVRDVGAPVGTSISVENLFFNTPARLKFLKKESTEKRHVATLVTCYAMAYPHIQFTLISEGREQFRSHGTGNLGDVLVRVLGLDQFKQMLEVQGDHTIVNGRTMMSVYGYASMAEFHRADRGRINLFVNGRWIQDSRITYAVVQAYHGVLHEGRYPVAILQIEMPPEDVDVNVHPTKAEVRFQDTDAVFSLVQRAVRQAIVASTQLYSQQMIRQEPRWRDETPQQADMAFAYEQDDTFVSADANVDDPGAIPAGPLKPRTLPMLRVVGQVGARYIVAEGPAGMYLIDQHAAHHRILYEQFREENLRAQSLVQPLTIELSSSESVLLEHLLSEFSQLGFAVEPFGGNTYVIREVPEQFLDRSADDVIEIIHSLERQDVTLDDLILAVARQVSVRAGHILHLEEMQALVRKLERCELPRTSPDGLPTLLHFSGDDIEREFNRR